MNLTTLAADAAAVLKLLQPALEAEMPISAEAITIGAEIAAGVLNDVPAAIAAYNTFKAGGDVTPAQLGALYDDEKVADADLHAAIAAKLAGAGADLGER